MPVNPFCPGVFLLCWKVTTKLISLIFLRNIQIISSQVSFGTLCLSRVAKIMGTELFVIFFL